VDLPDLPGHFPYFRRESGQALIGDGVKGNVTAKAGCGRLLPPARELA